MKKILLNDLFFPKLKNFPIGTSWSKFISSTFALGFRMLGLLLLSVIISSIILLPITEEGFGKQITPDMLWPKLILGIAALPLLYFVISSINMSYHWWHIFFDFINNKSNGHYVQKYENSIHLLNRRLRQDFMNQKLNNNITIDITSIYQEEESKIFFKIQKEYVEKHVKNSSTNYNNIDRRISLIKQQFDNIIQRKYYPS